MPEENTDIRQFSYYIIPDIKALKEERDPEKLRRHRRRIAACIGDPDALRAILGDASEDFQDFYGISRLPNLSTSDTIDSFLRKFGTDTPTASQADNLTTPLPDNPTTYNVSDLEDQPVAEGFEDSTLGAIDSFLTAQPARRPRPKKEVKEVEKPSLTESFAKILIKNGNYSHALEIITQISLNNPEKSIYFADQIRFLKKVISLESLKS